MTPPRHLRPVEAVPLADTSSAVSRLENLVSRIKALDPEGRGSFLLRYCYPPAGDGEEEVEQIACHPDLYPVWRGHMEMCADRVREEKAPG